MQRDPIKLFVSKFIVAIQITESFIVLENLAIFVCKTIGEQNPELVKISKGKLYDLVLGVVRTDSDSDCKRYNLNQFGRVMRSL